MELLFASSNPHKLEEIRRLLPERFALLSLKDAGIHEDIPETGETLAENAMLKALYAQRVLAAKGRHLAVFADDSGLEVNALNGAPGVYSARFAGVPKNDSANNRKLLEELEKQTKREARFVTVIALLLGNERFSFEGEIRGTIAYAGRGEQGFGYDPLFIPRGYRSTFAELGPEVKNRISHRAEAVKKLLDFLNTL